jgi:queuine tRNA-ribosyltransferase
MRGSADRPALRAQSFAFEIAARDGDARAGRLVTPHGVVETPAFMAVATYGAVRGILPDEIRAAGGQILLANTYHLHERPGEDVVARAGGLHGFAGWTGPWLTDSGGYQAFSLGDRAVLDEDGVTFVSTLDGSRRRLTPESAVAIQEALGPDIAVALDHCVPTEPAPDGGDPAAAWGDAMERSLRWGERCMKARRRADQALFGILQGGADAGLRRASARATAAQGFDGYAHGGLGLGEAGALRAELLAACHAELPSEAPRYLMGLGKPEDLILAVERGVDLFDCVVPTRNGRHGVLFTSRGRLSLRNARFREDPGPPDPGCPCPACSGLSLAYLRHLFAVGDLLGPRLASLHNLTFYYRLLAGARKAIAEGRFAAWRDRALAAARGGEE